MRIKSPITPIHNLPPIDYITVANITERDAIPINVRYLGFHSFVVSENKQYKLMTGLTNIDWEEIVIGGLPTVIYYDNFTLTALDISNNYITLTNTPDLTKLFQVNLNGIILFFGIDYALNTLTLTFIQNIYCIVHISLFINYTN